MDRIFGFREQYTESFYLMHQSDHTVLTFPNFGVETTKDKVFFRYTIIPAFQILALDKWGVFFKSFKTSNENRVAFLCNQQRQFERKIGSNF